jgi:hypothetical protein
MAGPALAARAQQFARQAVDGIAMRTDNMQRSAHVHSGYAKLDLGA